MMPSIRKRRHQTEPILRNGDSYLIDKNGDGQWDYIYSLTNGLTSYQEPRKTPGFELVFVLSAIAILIILGYKKRK